MYQKRSCLCMKWNLIIKEEKNVDSLGWGGGCGTILNPGRLIYDSANKVWVGNVACWSQLLPVQLALWHSVYVKVASLGHIVMYQCQGRKPTKHCVASRHKLEKSDCLQWIYCRVCNITLVLYIYIWIYWLVIQAKVFAMEATAGHQEDNVCEHPQSSRHRSTKHRVTQFGSVGTCLSPHVALTWICFAEEHIQ